MERGDFSAEYTRLVTPEEREYLERTLGSLGLYDASQDVYSVTEHPEDEKWIIQSNN
jgi:hypothetical protein